MAVDCPAMGVPPAIDILVVLPPPGFGVELREPGVDFDLFFVNGSDIK